MDNVDMAQENMEHAHHHAEGHSPDRSAIMAALLVAIMAAAAVVFEMSGNDAQIAYLSAHIAASDAWTEYQAKSVRRALYTQMAEMLPPDKAAKALAEAARMESEPGANGMRQLADQAHAQEAKRGEELRTHVGLERGVRGLQIAIVLSGLFMVTRVRWLLAGGFGLGVVSALYAGWIMLG